MDWTQKQTAISCLENIIIASLTHNPVFKKDARVEDLIEIVSEVFINIISGIFVYLSGYNPELNHIEATKQVFIKCIQKLDNENDHDEERGANKPYWIGDYEWSNYTGI